ncbi:hypothetical protein COT75_00060 [Candidatus Beckwithbacteria bacterium CG10_big_fil_rev_8_21_14_0_10_34_10]|uniref:Methyltransferase type 11 domain-containing protein n=1 Tax=Candidatus Beckwithbacteria bacterium CG10_big_fil_rev_8_21_14_0_10_34_10 TaxID=1974495 RepID=A0A2H0WCC9_9BACT|nr:MAG: hypothetical protein COT75_00060 [Candidatus Beckwithbacteria bacterium CG10_big_fil_rev_8_21_14_0_10_34_10]
MKNLDFKPNDLVLEIGSGHNPHPRSNILVDRYLTKVDERSGFKIKNDRPLVIASGEKLPFLDNSFDYIIANQVIEHVENPRLFCQELSRVGKRGLIICPHAVREEIFGWQHHLWWIFSEKNTLNFYSKLTKDKKRSFFHKLYQNKTFFRQFCNRQENKLNIYLHWKKKIKIKVHLAPDKTLMKKVRKEASLLLDKMNYSSINSFAFYFKEILIRLALKARKTGKSISWIIKKAFNPNISLDLLIKIIVCPNCRKKLRLSSKGVFCQSCNIKYPLIDNVPILLDKEEMKKGY